MSALAQIQTTLKLLSDATRLRLLALLAAEELAVHELVAITGLLQSRVSNHLSLLKRAGLVRDRRDGSWSFHSLVEPSPDGPLTRELFDAVIAPFRDGAEGRADALALEAVREQRRQQSRSAHDALASRWGEVGHEFALGSLRFELLGAIAPRELVVADLGCGAGELTAFLAGRCARVVAVDHSANMLETARRHVRAENVEFRRGELDDLPLADAEADAVFLNLVWHHVADMDRVAREVYRVLRPRGVAVICDLLPHDEEWMRERLGDLRLGVKPEVVVALLVRAGFTQVGTSASHDRYRIQSPDGRSVELPLFVARGARPVSAAGDRPIT